MVDNGEQSVIMVKPIVNNGETKGKPMVKLVGMVNQ